MSFEYCVSVGYHPYELLMNFTVVHFQVDVCLAFKARPGAQPFKWK